MISWPTTADLSRDIGISEKILEEMADAGELISFQNPVKVRQNRKAKRHINPFYLQEALEKVFHLPTDFATRISQKYLKIV